MIALALIVQGTQSIPAHAAYAEPNEDGIRIDGQRMIDRWTDPKQSLGWYAEAASDGSLGAKVRFAKSYTGRLTLTVGKSKRSLDVNGSEADFGAFSIRRGAVRIALSTANSPGPVVTSLEVKGDARFATSTRRNAASVHLMWPTPPGSDVRWFYNEAKMITDPVHSYTMACGFDRGYFGMQVNSRTERRIIFSVWDSGDEAVDRNKVSPEDRVQLVAKGADVVADSFGNEGTGGHSHLVFPWKTGQSIRFLVGARPEGKRTLYAGYFMAPGDKAWRLVAAFRAPKAGQALRGLYSFSENFWGSNGQLWRESEFGNGWLGMGDGSWKPVTEARFSHDGHGRAERWDYDAYSKGNRFRLRHGGFVGSAVRYGDSVTVERREKAPDFPLPPLPN